jgi:vancomycin resistance protein YoaR
MRSHYEPKLAEANRERSRLEQAIQSLTNQIAVERERLNLRVAQLEQAIPEAQNSARKQGTAELQARFDAKLEEANRLRSRAERKHLESADEWESEKRRMKKEIAALEDQLKETKELAHKAQKAGSKKTSDFGFRI